MSNPPNDSNLLLTDEDAQGWYKLVIPGISDVFGVLWHNPVANSNMELLSFIYCKFDPEQVAFDVELSQPMYAIDKVCLVQADRTPKQGSKLIPVTILSLSVLSAEHEGRCFLPTHIVSCIIPVRSDNPLVVSLKEATTESLLVAPTPQEASSVLNLPGNTLSE